MPTARIYLPPGDYTGIGIDGGTVPALTSGSIVQTAPAVGTLLTVTGSNAIAGATFQWNRGGSPISGATSATYLVVSADVGQVITRTVSLGDKQDPATTAGVTVATQPVITGVPTIAGTTTVGQTLTATPASVTGTPTPARTWQWRRAGTPIAGATSATYTLVSADVGQTLTVVQIETNAADTATAESAATDQIAPAPVNPAITVATFTPGTPNTLTITVTYPQPPADTLRVILATRNGGTALTASQMQAGTGTFLETYIIDPFISQTVNLDTAFTSLSNAATAIDILAVEANNGGVSLVVPVAVSGLNFGTGWSISGSSILSSPTVAPPTVSGSSITG